MLRFYEGAYTVEEIRRHPHLYDRALKALKCEHEAQGARERIQENRDAVDPRKK